MMPYEMHAFILHRHASQLLIYVYFMNEINLRIIDGTIGGRKRLANSQYYGLYCLRQM